MDMDVVVESPKHENDGKLRHLFEGAVHPFPGNISLMQYFQNGFGSRIDPTKIAVIDDENRHTFQDLDERSAKLAEAIRQILDKHALSNTNPDKDVVIGVCIPPSDKLILTLFAIMKYGAAYLPYEVSFPAERVVKITENARPIMIISDRHSNVVSKFDVVKDRTVVVTTAELWETAQSLKVDGKQTPQISLTTPPYEKTAIVLYTSGSSGEPKGVRLNHRTIMNRLFWQWQTFPFTEDDKCVFKTSLTFVDSVAEIFSPLLQGYPLVCLPKTITTNPNQFIQKLDLHKITRLVLVPSLLRAIFNTIKIVGAEAQKMLDSVKLWVCSGEALTKDLAIEFFHYLPQGFTLCNFYGSTEIMGDVTYISYSSIKEVSDKSIENHIPIGEPIFNTIIYFLNDKLEIVEEGELGEIYVGGYNLAKGYVGMANDPRFIANPYCKTLGFDMLYKTGDFGRIAYTKGKLRTVTYEGRVDSQIKVRGQRVDLSEIEMVMGGINQISKVKVLCHHPGLQDQTIVAFVVPSNQTNLNDIKSLVESKLREYERPVIRIIDDVPLLVNGKTDRQRLLRLYEQDLAQRTSMVDWDSLDIDGSKKEIAKVVITTMSEITGTDAETIVENLDNSFFNVGGSSLNSIQVIVKLHERKCYIKIPEFVGAKTIREIIDNTLAEGADAKLTVSEKGEQLYTVGYLNESDKEDVCHIIAHSFSHHGDLEKFTDSTYDDFQRLVKSIWEPLVEKGLSFIIRRKAKNEGVGVALNFDVYDEPSEIELCQGIQYVLDMLEHVEAPQREKLPKGVGKLVHSFMMGTPEELDESENVFVIQFMEEYVIKMAKEKGFIGVMTTNSNPLTQQIGTDIHGYETLSNYQVNQYVAPDGTRPFILAPDSFTIICCWKKLA